MKRTLITRSLLALVTATLIGCGGGGSDGINTNSISSSGAPPITTSGATDMAALSSAATANLSIAGSVQGVAIHSPPVITFQLVNSDNNTALSGFDQWTVKKSTDAVASYTNFAFSIAKLVPGTNGSPNKWVSYMVSTPTIGTDGTITGYTPGRPGSESNGALVYLGNGQYQYTFRRDITQVPKQLASFQDTASSKLAELGDLNYDPNAIHRLVIQVSGAVRGATTSSTTTTSCNTSNGTCAAGATYEFIRTPVDLVYDWIPATGRVVKVSDTDVEQREIVNVAACATCHNKFTFHGDAAAAVKGWSGGRQETRQCVVCHTDQRKFGRAGSTTMDASGNFTSSSTYTIDGISTDNNHSLFDYPVFIHKIHMGEALKRTGYNAGVAFNETKYPQLITNCAKCHSGDAKKPDGTDNTVTKLDGTVVQMATAQGNNWNTKPNRLACGACHDGINFNTGRGTTLAGATTGHGGGGIGEIQADDSKCSTCHTSDAIKKVHVAVTPQDKNSSLFKDCASAVAGVTTCNGNTNAAWLAANPNNLPAGAIKVTYDIKDVSRNSSKNPVMVFRMLQNGVPVAFKAPPAVTGLTELTTPKLSTTLSNAEMWDNFMGSPSVYFVFARPQDGVIKPADFNGSSNKYLRSIWNGKDTGATMSVPDANGYYTVTFTGVILNDDATMLTGGLGYTYSPASTMPLTQTNLLDYPVTAATADGTLNSVTLTLGMPNKTGGLIVVSPDAQMVGTSGAAIGGTGGAYTARRAIVDDKRCNNCHQELGAFNDSQFHAGQRNDGSTCSWCHNPNRTSSGWSADSTNFIHGIHGSLKRKNDFTWHASSTTDGFWSIGYPGVLKNCEACHLPGSYDFSANGRVAAVANKTYRYAATGTFSSTPTAATPDAQALAVFSYSPYVEQDGGGYGAGYSTTTNGTPVEATSGALVESPTATACFACHDDCDVLKNNTIVNGSKYLCPTRPTAKAYTKNVNLGGVYARDHMLANGGVIYGLRGSVATPDAAGGEKCLTCHGPTSVANIKAVHSK